MRDSHVCHFVAALGVGILCRAIVQRKKEREKTGQISF